MGWETSRRRSQLPRDWTKRVAATKRVAEGRCQAVVHATGCDGIGAECDHRSDPNNHDDLQWLSVPCHKAKTQAEAQAGKAKRPRQPRRHPADN